MPSSISIPDLRFVHFEEIQARLDGNRHRVWDTLLVFGPATGSELAEAMNWSVLSVRPRLTELREMRFVEATGDRRDGEHVFRALTQNEVKQLIDDAKQSSPQAELAFA